jgi:restriction system protein
MNIPDFQSFLLPSLQLAATRDVRVRDSLDFISDKFDLTEEDREVLLPSGKRTVVASRLSWALYYLARAGMLENNTRGVYSITPKGRGLLE